MGWVAAAMAIYGAYTSYVGGEKASDAASQQAAEEARIEGMLTGAKTTRLRQDMRQMEGQQLAGYAGSGVQVSDGTGVRAGGSVFEVLAETRKNFLAEIGLTANVGASRAAQIQLHGSNVGRMARYQGNAQAASTIGSFLAQYGTTWGTSGSSGNSKGTYGPPT